MRQYILCLYDLEGNLIAHRRFACVGCAKKRAPKQTPACLREDTVTGKIIWENTRYMETQK